MCWRTYCTWWPVGGEIQCHGKLSWKPFDLNVSRKVGCWFLSSLCPVTGDLCQSPARTIHFPPRCLTDGNKPAVHHGVIYGSFCSKLGFHHLDLILWAHGDNFYVLTCSCTIHSWLSISPLWAFHWSLIVHLYVPPSSLCLQPAAWPLNTNGKTTRCDEMIRGSEMRQSFTISPGLISVLTWNHLISLLLFHLASSHVTVSYRDLCSEAVWGASL